jgi:hypothetical protein
MAEGAPIEVVHARLEGGACDGVELLIGPDAERIGLSPFADRPDGSGRPAHVEYASARRLDGAGRAVFEPVRDRDGGA